MMAAGTDLPTHFAHQFAPWDFGGVGGGAAVKGTLLRLALRSEAQAASSGISQASLKRFCRSTAIVSRCNKRRQVHELHAAVSQRNSCSCLGSGCAARTEASEGQRTPGKCKHGSSPTRCSELVLMCRHPGAWCPLLSCWRSLQQLWGRRCCSCGICSGCGSCAGTPTPSSQHT